MNNSDIIKALAKGVNPITGKLISNDDLLSDPAIIRALYSAVESMKSGNIDHSSSNNLTSTSTTREDNNIKKGLPKNHRKTWDSNSIDELVYKFKNGDRTSSPFAIEVLSVLIKTSSVKKFSRSNIFNLFKS